MKDSDIDEETKSHVYKHMISMMKHSASSSRDVNAHSAILNNLVLEHMVHTNDILSYNIYKRSNDVNTILTREDLVTLLNNRGVRYDKIHSLLYSIVDHVHSNETTATRDASTQYDNSYDNILYSIDNNHSSSIYRNQNTNSSHNGESLKSVMGRMKRDMEREYEGRIDALRDKIAYEVKVKLQDEYNKKIIEVHSHYNEIMSTKMRGVRKVERQIEEEERNRIKHMETVRTNMNRKIMNDMHTLDSEIVQHNEHINKQHEIFKNIQHVIDMKNIDMEKREKRLEEKKSINEELMESKMQSINHINHTNNNHKYLETIDVLTSKIEKMQKDIDSNGKMVEDFKRHVREKDLQLEGIHKKYNKSITETSALREALDSFTALGKNKDDTNRILENRIYSLEQENMRLKENVHMYKKMHIDHKFDSIL